MSDHDPTFAHIREGWSFQQTREHDWTVDIARELFDAAMAAHDAEIRADAWDEGYTRGFYDRELMHGEVRDASEGPSANPYREEDTP